MAKPYSDFRATLALVKASFTSILRSPSSVVFTLVFPLVFIFIFGLISNSGVKLHVGVKNETANNEIITEIKKHNPEVVFEYYGDTATLADRLRKGHLDAEIVVTKNAYSVPLYNTHVIYTSASMAKGRILKAVISSTVAYLNNSASAPSVTSLSSSQISGREFKSIDFILPGQLGFSLLSTGVFATAFVFFNLRQNLVIKRFFTTPVRKSSIILGEAFARIIFSLLGSLILIVVGHWLFKFTLLNGVVTVINMLVLSALGLIIFMGCGFAISGMAKSESTIPPISNIVTLPQFLLSGTFFSTDVFPAWLQPISKVLPLTFLNDALRKISFEGASLWDVKLQVLGMLLWGIAIYAVAVKTFKWE